MTTSVNGRRETWKGARVAVVGLARSGVAACRFLTRRGAAVVATDRRREDQLGEVPNELRALGVELFLGSHPDLVDFDLIVLSPGVDPGLDVVEKARSRGVRMLPELELGALEVTGRIICITGTKGKSTTTMSLFAMLQEGGFDARAVGNIGSPITAHVDDSDENTLFVTEASSFQLETTTDFHAHAAVFLNLFPDHLDRHPSFHAYAEAKARLFVNQNEADTAVINGDDDAVGALAARTSARIIPFRPKTPLDTSKTGARAGFDGFRAIFRGDSDVTLFHEQDVQIPGSAVRANLLAAATTAHLFGVASPSIQRAVRAFCGVPHTFEKLGEIEGVTFFNDSKATTLESVEAALRAFHTPVIAIMGGRLKAGSFRSLRSAVAGGVRSVYAIGESRPLIREALGDVCSVQEVDSMEEAVRLAYAEAVPGDTVLLSPGCSSFDMFRDYSDRGDTFARAFRNLSLKGVA